MTWNDAAVLAVVAGRLGLHAPHASAGARRCDPRAGQLRSDGGGPCRGAFGKRASRRSSSCRAGSPIAAGLLDTGWDRPEARVFADAAIGEGVPAEAILLEERAQNTGDNFSFGVPLLEQAGIHPAKLIVVAKPYMTRRGFATGTQAAAPRSSC